MARTDPQVKVRLPKDVKAFIAAEAAANASSLSSEIVRAIRGAMRAQEAGKPRGVSVLTAQMAEGPGKSRSPVAENDHASMMEKSNG